MQKIIVAIDGFAATGKSTQAKRLAKALKYTYIDTGAMYRAVTHFALQQAPKGKVNPTVLVTALDQIKIHFENTPKGQQTYLNNTNITKAIRQAEVTTHVSSIAKIPAVRSFLVQQQQAMGEKKGIVMDGRDIGTVVFPAATCKFFLTASPEVRAKRRYIEQLEQGNDQPYEDVLASINTRDQSDSTRKASPLTKAKDAIEIDVSNLSLDEVYELLWGYISKSLAEKF